MKYIPKDHVKVRKSDAGLGLFAGDVIKKGDFIIEYVGEIVGLKEADRRGGKYLFETSANRFIDGTDRKNKARYINHSCKPNCEVEIRRGRVLVFAKKNIKVGEELHYDYGDEYVNHHIKPYGCRCFACKANIEEKKHD